MFARTARWIFLIAVCAGLFLGRVSRHGRSADEAFAEAREAADANYDSHQDLTYFRQSDGSAAPIKTASDWQRRRKQILAGMQEVMGPLPHPEKPVKLDVQILEEHQE